MGMTPSMTALVNALLRVAAKSDETKATEVFTFFGNKIMDGASTGPGHIEQAGKFIDQLLGEIAQRKALPLSQLLWGVFSMDGSMPKAEKITLEDLRDLKTLIDDLPPPTQDENRAWMLQLLTSNQGGLRVGVSSLIGGTVQDDQGNARYLYTYSGIIFRSDTREYDVLKKAGGLTSQNDLSIDKHRIESQGIMSKGHGATGHSGASCAKDMAGAYNYGEFKTGRNRMYVIDTASLGAETAYDMSAIVKRNYPLEKDGTGDEINCTSVPLKAILGYIEYSPDVKPSTWSRSTYTATP